MNPEDVLEGPFMGLRYFDAKSVKGQLGSIYSAADNRNYSQVAEYSKKENSSYQEAA